MLALNILMVGVGIIAITAIDVGRAYVTGEGLYSKGQKSALIRLQQFVYTGDIRRYDEFRDLLRVPIGDRIAREALSQERADYETARQGFLQGQISSDDIFGMSVAYVYLKSWRPLAEAVADWRDADDLISQLSALGRTSYLAIIVDRDMSGAARLTKRITYIDHRLTELESEFSARVNHIEHLIRLIALYTLLGLSVLFSLVAGYAIRKISLSTMQSEQKLEQSNRALGEAKLSAEKADHSKSAFLASMSHELRTPLNAIIGYSEMMVAQILGPLNNPRYVQYAGDIHRAGEHLLELINDILDISRIEAGKLELRHEEVDLARLFRSIVALTDDRARKGEITVAVTLPREKIVVLGDELRLKQILLNLVANAIKFTNPHGQVELGAMHRPDRSLELWVRDNGIGMTPEQITLALQPFSQIDHDLNRKHQGTGLGLPITNKLVALHGGRSGSRANTASAPPSASPSRAIAWRRWRSLPNWLPQPDGEIPTGSRHQPAWPPMP